MTLLSLIFLRYLCFLLFKTILWLRLRTKTLRVASQRSAIAPVSRKLIGLHVWYRASTFDDKGRSKHTASIRTACQGPCCFLIESVIPPLRCVRLRNTNLHFSALIELVSISADQCSQVGFVNAASISQNLSGFRERSGSQARVRARVTLKLGTSDNPETVH